MAQIPKLENCAHVLIVEGYSDLLFFAEFLESLQKHNSVYIKHFNGRSDLIAKLETFLTPQLRSEKQMIGVIVDGDENPAGTFEGLQKKLQELTGKQVPHSGGWSAGSPTVGLFVAPNTAHPGEIETLVWRAWAASTANAAAKSCVEAYVKCMATSAKLAPKSPDKGLISALLAICNDEDPRLGPGARAGIFDFTHREFDSLRVFLDAFSQPAGGTIAAN
jgi:hypothetical protein